MLLLAIDTSTTAITAALHDGAAVLAQSSTLDARAHTEHLAPGIRSVLADAGREPGELTDVVCGIGPGPFTGLRVGIVTARTVGFSLGIPVRGLTSHDAVAHEAWLAGRRGGLLVATDARRKEVYAARYDLDDEGAHRLEGPVVAKAADLPGDWRSLPAAGRGPGLWPDVLSGSGLPLDVSAGALADLAARRLQATDVRHDAAASGESDAVSLQHVDAGGGFDGLEPLYLRRPDAAPAVITAPPG